MFDLFYMYIYILFFLLNRDISEIDNKKKPLFYIARVPKKAKPKKKKKSQLFIGFKRIRSTPFFFIFFFFQFTITI